MHTNKRKSRGSASHPVWQRHQASLPPLQWSGPKPRVAGPAWAGARVATFSTKLEPFFRAPPRRSSAAPQGARPAAGAENFQAPRQPADFTRKLGHLARLSARRAGRHPQPMNDARAAVFHLDCLAPPARRPWNIQPAPFKRTQRSVLRRDPRQARSANGDGATRAGRCREGSPAR